MPSPIRIRSIRPLVRYVDEDQAVIDAHIRIHPVLADQQHPAPPDDLAVDVEIEIDGADGFHDEGNARLQLHGLSGSVRFELVRPQLWWPAGLGEQALYEMKIRVTDQAQADELGVTFGLTSVRRNTKRVDLFDPTLLVNGQNYDISSVVVVDRISENRLLPAAGDSLLLVRDHFGPDLLYEAADRAGILLVQCVPIQPSGELVATVSEQIDRLASHPSLVGYYVGHLGDRKDHVTRALRDLDPTRSVFQKFPVNEAA